MVTLLQLNYVLLTALTIGSCFCFVPVPTNLILSSAFIIYIGAHRSLDNKEAEVMTSKDAWMFPVIGSCVLFSLYVAFKFLSKYYINLMLGIYFSVIGVIVLAQAISPVVAMVLTSKKWVIDIQTKPKNWLAKRFVGSEFELRLTAADIVGLIVGAVIAVLHGVYKHHFTNNLLGIAFSVQGIELLALGSYMNGAIMLVGLFAYDIFWVFGTDVMVTVARSFQAPIKLLFVSAFATEEADTQFSMLGLGDIVIPGVFLALLLRYDVSRTKKKQLPNSIFDKPYFNVCMIGYCLGLATTVTVMYVFQAAQPALLYLSPACLLFSMGTAVYQGEFKQLLGFTEEEKKEEEQKEKVEKDDTAKDEDSGKDAAKATEAAGAAPKEDKKTK